MENIGKDFIITVVVLGDTDEVGVDDVSKAPLRDGGGKIFVDRSEFVENAIV